MKSILHTGGTSTILIIISISFSPVSKMVMVVGETSMELDQCFQMTMMNMEGVSIKEWKDIPVELLMRILPLVDDRNVIAASGVCSGWRDAISLGLTRLRLSWYLSDSLKHNHLFSAIGNNCNQMQSLNLGRCEKISDDGVMSLAYGCPDLRTLDLCGCVLITEELRSLNISQCTALTPSAVQAVCDTFPALHTCSGRHSLVMSGCLNLTSVHCACILQAHRVVPLCSLKEREWVNVATCGVCQGRFSSGYGGYACIDKTCDYVLHSTCATYTKVWDGIDVEGEEFEEAKDDVVSSLMA
ncbi:hypothetical protein Bca4012_006725 [Brassica carinata]